MLRSKLRGFEIEIADGTVRLVGVVDIHVRDMGFDKVLRELLMDGGGLGCKVNCRSSRRVQLLYSSEKVIAPHP